MQLRVGISYRQILSMALPISLAMVVPQINFVTNTIFLSGLGEQSLASAGITGVYYMIFAVMGNGLNNGLQALIARKAGQNLPGEIGHLYLHGVLIAFAIAALGIAISYTVAPMILEGSIRHREIADQVLGFLYIRIWGLPILYLYASNNALLVGTNQTKLLIWGTLSEALANIFFDYALIYGHYGFPTLGFNGAAYASILAELAGVLAIGLVIVFKKLPTTFQFWQQRSINRDTIKNILTTSSPLIAQYILAILTWEYFYILIEHQGERSLAISNTMRNTFGMFGIFAWAFASTTNTMVSNIVGQGREEEVMKLVKRIVKLSFSFAAVVFVILNLAPEWFLTLYGQKADFIEEAVPVVRIVSMALLMMSIGTVWLNAVTGLGKTLINLTIEGITLVIYIVYVYLVIGYWDMPLTWGWVSEWVYWVSMFSMAYYYVTSGRWRKVAVTGVDHKHAA